MRKLFDNIRYAFNLWCEAWLAVSDSLHPEHCEGEVLGGYLTD